jgi:hypothetical protein
MHGRTHRPRGPATLLRRGRGAVVTLLMAWAAVQLILSVTANVVWPGLRDPMYYDKVAKLRRRIAERTTAAGPPQTVVMFGSSRTLMGLDGQALEAELAGRVGRPVAALNLGIPAAGPITTAVNLRRLLRDGPQPDVVLIEVLPPLLAGQPPVPREQAFLLPERLRANEVPLVLGYGFPAEETRARWQLSTLVPVYGLRFPLLGRLVANWRPANLRFDVGRLPDPTGWMPAFYSRVTAEEYRHGVARAWQEYYELLQSLRLDGPSVRALRTSLELCHARGVPAALVLMPEGTDFRAWYPPSVASALADFLAGLAAEFGVSLIDARPWLGDEAFSDGHHMLPSGAAEFTRRLGAELLLLLHASGSPRPPGGP